MRVLAIWLAALFFGRDIVSLASVQSPREAFASEAKKAQATKAETARVS